MIIACYIAAVAADVWTTLVARRRGLREGNPLLRAAGSAWIPVRLGLALIVLLACVLTDAPAWILPSAAAVYGAVAVSNVLVLRSAGRAQ